MTAPAPSFDPSTSDPNAFREALGRFGTGVTIVTCMTPNGPIGITANSFASVSLDPPLVLWSPAKNSARYPSFMAAKHYAIHVVGHEQQDLCTSFVRQGADFDLLDWELSETGVPLLNGCLSRFECTLSQAHDGGDHTIVVGHVNRVTTRHGTPLMFFNGTFGSFAKPS